MSILLYLKPKGVDKNYNKNVYMNISMTYDELANLVNKKTGQDVWFEFSSEDTVKICKQVHVSAIKVLNFKKKIKLGVTVLGFEGNDLHMKLSSEVLSWFLNKSADGVSMNGVVEITGQSVIVHLDKIEKLNAPLKQINPKSLSFSEKGVTLAAEIKT